MAGLEGLNKKARPTVRDQPGLSGIQQPQQVTAEEAVNQEFAGDQLSQKRAQEQEFAGSRVSISGFDSLVNQLEEVRKARGQMSLIDVLSGNRSRLDARARRLRGQLDQMRPQVEQLQAQDEHIARQQAQAEMNIKKSQSVTDSNEADLNIKKTARSRARNTLRLPNGKIDLKQSNEAGLRGKTFDEFGNPTSFYTIGDVTSSSRKKRLLGFNSGLEEFFDTPWSSHAKGQAEIKALFAKQEELLSQREAALKEFKNKSYFKEKHPLSGDFRPATIAAVRTAANDITKNQFNITSLRTQLLDADPDQKDFLMKALKFARQQKKLNIEMIIGMLGTGALANAGLPADLAKIYSKKENQGQEALDYLSRIIAPALDKMDNLPPIPLRNNPVGEKDTTKPIRFATSKTVRKKVSKKKKTDKEFLKDFKRNYPNFK